MCWRRETCFIENKVKYLCNSRVRNVSMKVINTVYHASERASQRHLVRAYEGRNVTLAVLKFFRLFRLSSSPLVVQNLPESLDLPT